MDTVLIDSPFANIRSVRNALVAAGTQPELTSDPDRIASSARVVLPGVGNFSAAMSWLVRSGVAEALTRAVEHGAWLLGICVGHQLLFERSDEGGESAGLGFLEGGVERFSDVLAVPQIGWNRVFEIRGGSVLFSGIESGCPFYFVNSYRVRGTQADVAWSEYGERFTAAVRRDRVYGVQFHPERSSGAGIRLLGNFLEVSS